MSDIPLTEDDVQLAALFNGRPCRVQREDNGWLIILTHELSDTFVTVKLSDADMAIPAYEFIERYVNPAIHFLEQAIFPRRMERVIAAARELAERCKPAVGNA